jgi:Na+/H+-dicarboxylate symporter
MCLRWSSLKSLYVQVLIGIAAGVVLGFVVPERGAAMRPLGDGFIIALLLGVDRFMSEARSQISSATRSRQWLSLDGRVRLI